MDRASPPGPRRAIVAVGCRDGCGVNVRIPPTSVSQGWVRLVRFQEVGRIRQMTEKGAKQPRP